MDYLPLPENALRQLIDSMTVFGEFQRVQKQARPFAGGMYWKRQGDYEYLVRTQPDGRQGRIGPRSPDTEKVHADFTASKTEAESRLKSLRSALKDAERLNKALKVGRVPSAVVAVLQAIEEAGLGTDLTVVGTHALYAYETAAGVRIVQDALAPRGVDLLREARKRLCFLTDMQRLERSMLGVLQGADPSFRRREGQNETAINDKGFEVDFLCHRPGGGDPHPTHAPSFEHVVVSATGRMTRMRTVSPASFVAFKRWKAKKAPGRVEVKKRRDLLQAGIVQKLLDEGLLHA